MEKFSTQYVRPLGEATNEFVQVLLDSFTLTRKGGRTTCEVTFDNATPCVWTRDGKAYLRQHISTFGEKQKRYAEELAAFIGKPAGKYVFSNEGFRFRFVSGGALPVVRMGGAEYFALIYRENFPTGWNLANGGSDTPAELLNPFAVAERELREELLVLNPTHGQRYVFDSESENPVDMPEYLIARRLWRTRLMRKGWADIGRFEQVPMPLKWLDGPDTLKIKGNGNATNKQTDCYLNIRSEDFGIEVDRIAKLNLDTETVLLDGELVNGQLVGAPVGLFDVRRMASLIEEGADAFFPDFFFYDGRRFDGGKTNFQKVLNQKFLPHICTILPKWNSSEWAECPRPFDLCPVTRGILARAAKLWMPVKKQDEKSCDVFISFATPDAPLAAEVYKHFSGQMGLNTYFSKESDNADYNGAINSALESAKCLVAVGTSRENLQRRWPQYEYNGFHSQMKCGRKSDSAQLVSFISQMRPHELPLPLAAYNSVVKEDEERALERLGRFVTSAL
ncbi:MAG: toll/interleukin-1 receptor domain-containing protein [Candidatus Symbiothrix sp.]|jgi:hypothetical protein|nr:toll/interleukin-1 receptor domain-containing protein [Candidatus Symbiothrix sp.]